MFDDKTPPRPDPASERRTAPDSDGPAPQTRKDDAETSGYHYTDWALI